MCIRDRTIPCTDAQGNVLSDGTYNEIDVLTRLVSPLVETTSEVCSANVGENIIVDIKIKSPENIINFAFIKKIFQTYILI